MSTQAPLITQSAINTRPPISVEIEETDWSFWSTRYSGRIRVGSNCWLNFSHATRKHIDDIKRFVEAAYNIGYSEASTYFLNKQSSESKNEHIIGI